MNKEHLTGTVPVNNDYLTGTVPVNKKHLTGTERQRIWSNHFFSFSNFYHTNFSAIGSVIFNF